MKILLIAANRRVNGGMLRCVRFGAKLPKTRMDTGFHGLDRLKILAGYLSFFVSVVVAADSSHKKKGFGCVC